VPLAWCALALAATASVHAVQSPSTPRQLTPQEQTQREEGQALVSLADAAMAGERVPADFALAWTNHFLKAQHATFVPFIVSIDAPRDIASSALLYVRAVRRITTEEGRSRRDRAPLLSIAYDEIFPIAIARDAALPVRVQRGFALQPGDYELVVVVRERASAPGNGRRPRAAVLRRAMAVPDFWTGELTTSSIILADGMTALTAPLADGDLEQRPYVIGLNEIQPSPDLAFPRGSELIAVLLVYNPSVTEDRKFDLQVEYHFSKLTAGGEAYFNRTEPQRFNPAIMGPQYDPASGHPIMAGQGVPLAGFVEGKYRLSIKVTDLVSGKSLTRDVTFSVGS
jgi:hypothetical protein